MYFLLLHFLLTECLGLTLNITNDGQSNILIFNHTTANFGIRFSDSSYERSAPLIATEPEDGCNGIENGAELEGKIVIVKRGKCPFFEKALNVDFYKGKGLVVGNDEGDQLVLMLPMRTRDDVNIPCVFISKSNYDLAVKTLSQTNSVMATLSPREEYPINFLWRPPQGLTTIIIYMLLTFPFAWAVLTLLRACSRIPKLRTVKNKVRVIPEVIFNSEKLEANGIKLTNDSCPICLADFEEKTRIKLLPCDHGFHQECIEPWIKQHSDSCPLCRETVTDKLTLAKRDAPCCYSISSQRPLTGSSNQSFVEAVNLHDGQGIWTDSSEQDNINPVEQLSIHNDLSESIPLEDEAGEHAPEGRESPPFLTIILHSEENE